jgi:hypothetical protein
MHADSFRTSPVAAIRSPPTMNLSPLTLSGSNLQQRLNYPVPPTPTSQPSELSLSASLPRRGESLLPALSLSPLSDPLVPLLPSAEQLVNLQNRYSRAQPRIVPRPVSASYRRGYGYSPPEPPAQLGAAGRYTSPSGDRTVAPARCCRAAAHVEVPGLSPLRLLPQRPDYGRLDTIQSVAFTCRSTRIRDRVQRHHSIWGAEKGT